MVPERGIAEPMIKRVEYLKSFGLYRDFVWDTATLKDFKRYNLIYGWNYSGKTTLSRALQALERGELAAGLQEGTFLFTLDNGAQIDSRALTPKPDVRVFNRDYVRRNISAETAASAVYVVGEDAIKLRARIGHVGRRAAKVRARLAELSRERSDLGARRDFIGTDFARTVASQTRDKAFNRARLEGVARALPAPRPSPLTDEELAAEGEYVRRSGDLVKRSVNLSEAEQLIAIVRGLERDLQSSPLHSAMPELAGQVTLQRWVGEGVELHEGRDACVFCSGVLTDDRRAILAAHFSEAFQSLARRLTEAAGGLRECRPEVVLPKAVDIAPGCRSEFGQLEEDARQWNRAAQSLREEALRVIERKQSALMQAFEVRGINEAALLLADVDRRAKSVFVSHNAVVESQSARSGEASNRIREHWAVRLVEQLEQEDISGRIAAAVKRIAQSQGILSRCDSEVARLEKDANGLRRGAELMTEILGTILGDTAIAVRPDGGAGFRFERDGQPATNLSDGEQTAVTFAHFLASLESDEQSVEESIVFVDDPISSLDAGNVYAVFGAVQRRLMAIKQLFVATHNGEFFGYLKNLWLNGRVQRESEAYLVRRSWTTDGAAVSRLEQLPKALQIFSSEYEFLFAELVAFCSQEAPAMRDGYTSANMLRRFLESYLGFRAPYPRAWGDKLDLLITDPVRAAAIKKFCDDGSHLQAKHRLFEHAVFVANAQSIVREVVDALRVADPQHFRSVCEALALTVPESGAWPPSTD